jgi:hypothetical protein
MEKALQYGTDADVESTPAPVYVTHVPFEEYLIHAAAQRRTEALPEGHAHGESAPANYENHPLSRWSEKKGVNVDIVPTGSSDDLSDLTPDELERVNANRALRRATWAAVFYLITTDILGTCVVKFPHA